MLRITVMLVGKSKEAYWNQAVAEYAKRLSRYCRLDLVEVADEKTPDGASERMEEQIKEKEGRRLLERLPQDAYVIALAIEGKMPDSVGLARKLSELEVGGVSHIAFIIGGSLGLSKEVMRRAHQALSFSAMTFPHQMMRVILLEQLYRSFRIIHNEPYHK